MIRSVSRRALFARLGVVWSNFSTKSRAQRARSNVERDEEQEAMSNATPCSNSGGKRTQASVVAAARATGAHLAPQLSGRRVLRGERTETGSGGRAAGRVQGASRCGKLLTREVSTTLHCAVCTSPENASVL